LISLRKQRVALVIYQLVLFSTYLQITGCSSGLGEALALTLHTSNFQVIATARRLEAVDHLAALGIQCLSLDVTDDDSVKIAISEILNTQGRLDILVNNAGCSCIGPIAEQPLSEVTKVMETNLFGVIRVTQEVVPIMAKQGYGLIINIGSVVSQLSTPWSAAYSASKAALLAVTDALRLEVKPFGIGVTYVIAGAIEYVFVFFN
jgi:1-acylglycerone phosphate reductase